MGYFKLDFADFFVNSDFQLINFFEVIFALNKILKKCKVHVVNPEKYSE